MSLQRQPKKRAQLSIDNKREICEYARQHPTLSHTDIAHYFNEKFNLSIYIEQQSDGAGIDFNDLRIFRKYIKLLSLEELELKRQQKIDNYFTKQL